ncbi:ANTAR domain-containing response regulator [Desmospora profundinema]|uniref:Response regulator NasT n=1 Tax=Desmospora profundinema TaxID=1571184 RepID=A0ABU1IL08_9BACL|nr:response regulator [Desmospora profundinema]MDR6225428.1 response regulator NasT [Desmospora profundinema]
MSVSSILLAEDESILRMDLREMLLEACYEIAGEAGNGDQAVELAHIKRPDLVIMDIKMPGMNGLKAGRIISRSLGIPILYLTAYSQRDLIEEAKQAFVTGYLVKPVRECELIPAVEVSLNQAERFSILRRDLSQLEKKLSSRKWVERAKGILMKKYAWSEEEAYQALRRDSMKQRVSLEELSKRIWQEETQNPA